MKPKYFGVYYGPSYGSWSMAEEMDGFESIKEAKESMRERQRGGDVTNLYSRNADGHLVLWETSAGRDFPGTTNADYMDLHYATGNGDGTYAHSEDIAYRITIGERGGIIAEKG